MNQGTHILKIGRQALKFSAAHMTVFPDGTKERLHGHNYQTELAIEITEGSRFAKMIPFDVFKKVMAEICEAWDERFLLPSQCPQLRIVKETEKELEFMLGGARYVMPRQDVAILPLENATTEALAEYFIKELLRLLPESVWREGNIVGLEARIEESPGLGASFRWRVS